MQLTKFTDYALRTLIFLGSVKGPASLDTISRAYGISRNHLVKAVNVLEKNSFIHTKRGVGGGITLARTAEKISLAEVVKCTENSFTLVECFDREKNQCVITEACLLKHILYKAFQQFMAELERYTLADILDNPNQIVRLLQIDNQ